jgi:CBS domain-containing protein
MKVREIMSARVHSVNPTDSLARAAMLMWDHDIGFLPVVCDQDNVIGTVTDRDLLMAAYTRGIGLEEATVASAMSHELHTVGPRASLRELASLMSQWQIRRMPVVDEFGTLVGVATLNDVNSYVVSNVGSTLSLRSIGKALLRLSARRRPIVASE